MIKRNDGYALSYVLVVLLVLFAIAMAASIIPLRNLQAQQSSLNRMKEKYAAQGQIEQIVGQLENATDEGAKSVIEKYILAENEDPTDYPYITKADSQYKIVGQSGNTKVTACIKLEKNTKPAEAQGTPQTESDEPAPSPIVIGHKVIYTSYSTEIITPTPEVTP